MLGNGELEGRRGRVITYGNLVVNVSAGCGAALLAVLTGRTLGLSGISQHALRIAEGKAINGCGSANLALYVGVAGVLL